jgi:hypothetical protein
VSTTVEVFTTTPQAISIATGALLVTLLDYRVIFGAMVLGTLVGAGYLLVALHGRMTVPASAAAEGQPTEAVLPESVLPGTMVEPRLPDAAG